MRHWSISVNVRDGFRDTTAETEINLPDDFTVDQFRVRAQQAANAAAAKLFGDYTPPANGGGYWHSSLNGGSLE